MKNLKMKSARVAKDLTQQGLADAIGVSRQTISAIEKGDYNPTINLCIGYLQNSGQNFRPAFWESEDQFVLFRCYLGMNSSLTPFYKMID